MVLDKDEFRGVHEQIPMKIRVLLVPAIVSAILVSCSIAGEQGNTPRRSEEGQSVTEIVEQIIVERVVTATENPNESATNLPEDDRTSVGADATSTQCAIPGDLFTVYGTAFLSNNRMLVTLESSSDVSDGAYTLEIGTSSYLCDQNDTYPRRLYCIGESQEMGREVPASLLIQGNPCPLFEGQVAIPEPQGDNGQGGSGAGSGGEGEGNGSGGGYD